MKINARQIAFLGLLLVFALMAGYVEFLIPPVIPAFPGIKLGLPNTAVLIIMYIKDYKSAFTVNILRIILAGILFTGIWGMVYSVCGALCSFIIMAGLKKSNIFGIAGISAAGGVFHNFGQISVAAFFMNTVKLYYYLPALIISGVASGLLIGYLSGLIINRIYKMPTESVN